MFAAPGRTDALHSPLSEQIAHLGGQVISIGAPLAGAFAIETPDLGELLAPLIEIIPVQYLGAAWRRIYKVGGFTLWEKK